LKSKAGGNGGSQSRSDSVRRRKPFVRRREIAWGRQLCIGQLQYSASCRCTFYMREEGGRFYPRTSSTNTNYIRAKSRGSNRGDLNPSRSTRGRSDCLTCGRGARRRPIRLNGTRVGDRQRGPSRHRSTRPRITYPPRKTPASLLMNPDNHRSRHCFSAEHWASDLSGCRDSNCH